MNIIDLAVVVFLALGLLIGWYHGFLRAAANLGALLLAMVAPSLTHMGINTYWTDLFTGAIIVLAVMASALRNFDFSAMKKRNNQVEVTK